MPFLISTRPIGKESGTFKVRCLEIRNIPLTEIRNPGYDEALRAELVSFNPDSLCFTSAFGVREFLKYYPDLIKSFRGNVFAIGDRTGEAIQQAGLKAIIPDQKDSPGLAGLILKTLGRGERVALIRSGNADPKLPETLNMGGVIAKDFHIYEVTASRHGSLILDAMDSPELSGIIVTSPMEAAILVNLAGPKIRVPIYAIGNTTAGKIRDLGYAVSEPLGESNFEDLVRKISEKYCPQ
ncbi:MAG: uroporphyrinogen-III synthase [Candidatus Thermoplasmatota archaeon]|jgi:uroporphyrinogen-III synthase|nr:uroporphyrinogen-III synthase [Candidatus Thermoplasmatota archaeon]